MSVQFRCRVVAAIALALVAATASAQDAPPAADATPIAIPDLVSQAETVNDDLGSIDRGLVADTSVAAIDADVPALTQSIDAEADETRRLLEGQPSLEALREALSRWNGFSLTLSGWQRDLTARAATLQSQLDRLDALQKTWDASLEVARGSDVPAEIVERVAATATAIRTTRAGVDERRGQALALQKRVGDQNARVNDALTAVKKKRDEAVGRLLVRDAPETWNLFALAQRPGELAAEMRDVFSTQGRTIGDYARRHVGNFVAHVAAFLLLVWGLTWARGWMRRWADEDPGLEGFLRVYRYPIATALVIAMLLSGAFYPRAPRLFVAILGAQALIPAVFILRGIVSRHLYPVLYATVVLFFVDRVGAFVQGLPLASRLVGLVETLGALAFLVWYAASLRTVPVDAEAPDRTPATARTTALAAAGAFVVALAANVLGYVTLEHLIESAIIGGAYSAVLLYVAVLIAEGLVVFALRVRPLSALAAVRQHRPLFRRRIMKGVRWLAAFVWVLVRLDDLTILERVFDGLRSALTAQLRVGVIAISAGDVFLFVVTVWSSVLLARFICFMLEEDVFVRVEFGRGIPYAITSVVRYVILALGFVFALGAVGIDLTRFTILTGAFGVGLGLGLQSIVNNFVSGLVLLFERPVNVGDSVQIGQHTGALRHIGLRASVVRTAQGSEVIVPNGYLISNEVVNWTLSDSERRIEIDVGVAYGTDPERVISLLTDVARAHESVLETPPPETLFMGFGDSALNFQLRAWTRDSARWFNIRSELAIGVNTALAGAEISIPFPQRDVRVLNAPPSQTDEAGPPST